MRSKLLVFKKAKSLSLLITGRNANPRHHCSRYCQAPFTLWSSQSRFLLVSKLSAKQFSQSRSGPLLPARYRIKRQFHGRTSQLRHQLSFESVSPIENVATDKRRAQALCNSGAPFQSCCVVQNIQDVEDFPWVVGSRAWESQTSQSDMGVIRLTKKQFWW